MVLVCETQGWYPEPEMVWRDSEGVSLSADPPETTTDSEGLYTLRLRVTVQKTHRNLFNCRVKQKYMERDETARIHVPGELFSLTYFSENPEGLGFSGNVRISTSEKRGRTTISHNHHNKKDNIIHFKTNIYIVIDRHCSIGINNCKIIALL